MIILLVLLHGLMMENLRIKEIFRKFKGFQGMECYLKYINLKYRDIKSQKIRKFINLHSLDLLLQDLEFKV